MRAEIFDIYKGSTHDGPGMRDVVFFKGCPLNCIWCHNPEGIETINSVWYEKNVCIGCGECLKACGSNAVKMTDMGIVIDQNKCIRDYKCIDFCPSGAIEKIANEYTVDGLYREILKDKSYFDASGGGVTASGGEAMLHADFICEFFHRLKNNGIHTALDTTGYCDDAKLFAVLKNTDMVIYDLKVVNRQLHRNFTGADNNLILENIVKISNYIKNGAKLSLWIRTPIIPGFTDSEKMISEIAEFINDNLSGTVQRWELCSFNNSCTHKYEKLGRQWTLSNTSLIAKEKMSKLKAIAKSACADEIVCSGLIKDSV